MTPDLFDWAASRQARDDGVAKVSQNDWVERARAFALNYAARNGEVTSDDLQRHMPRPASVHPNAVGAVFRTKLLQVIGYTQTERVSGHARTIKIYGLANTQKSV